MSWQTKADVKASVIDWLSEEALDDVTLDRAIALVEADVRRRLRVFQMEITTDFTIDQETEVVPSRWLAAGVFYIPGHKAMIYQTPEQLAGRQVGTSASRPLYYTIEGVQDALPVFRFSPAPDVSYTARLTYTADPALIDDADTNDILVNWPDVYHYGTLSHLAAYVGNEARLPNWERLYKLAMSDVQTADRNDKDGGSTLIPTKLYRGA
jgi:hypothetical protein